MKHSHQARQELEKELPGVMDAFTRLHDEVLKEGAVSIKHKKLTLTAIAVAVRCETCLRRHLSGAFSLGASREEIMEIVSVGMLMAGGPAVAFASEHVVGLINELEAGV